MVSGPSIALPPEQAVRLRDAVCLAYSAAAERPRDKHAFPVGRALAESAGYPPGLLDRLPAIAVEAFAGVSNVSVWAEIPAGARVLDLGCGAGLDAVIAAHRLGSSGCAMGVDFSEAMLARARQASDACGVRVTFLQADAERLPIETGSVDVALVNGIFNLNPARSAIFSELARVVRPGGTVFAAEIILQESVTRPPELTEAEWFR